MELRIKLVFVWPRALYYSKLAFCKSTGVCEGTNDVKEICRKSNRNQTLGMRHWKTVHWEITLHPPQASFLYWNPLVLSPGSLSVVDPLAQSILPASPSWVLSHSSSSHLISLSTHQTVSMDQVFVSAVYPQHVTGDTLYSIDTYWWMKAINSKAMWENDLCLREKWGKSLSFKKYRLLKTQFCGILDSKDVENSCTKQGLLPLWRWLNVAACFWWVLRLWVSIEHRTALQVQKLTF